MTATISIPTSDCEGLGSFFKTWATHSHIKHLDFHRIRDAKDRLLDLTTLTGMEEERRKEEEVVVEEEDEEDEEEEEVFGYV